MNIAALHPDITHIVAIAGFVSVKRMIKQSFNGIIRGYAKPVYELERFVNPDHVKYDAAETLKNSKVKALLIYSENDPIVNVNHHYRILEEELSGCENVTLMLCKNKGHNPHYTEEAVKYKDVFFKDLTKKRKAKALVTDESKKQFVASYDFNKMTEQDEFVWAKIF
jgi:pimeloyl-ACP methyl ester carboxylesterase